MRRVNAKPTAERSVYELLLLDVAVALGITQKLAREVVGEFIERLPDVVWAKGRFIVPRLGTFRVRSRKSRRIANPQTGDLMTLPRERVVAVRASGHWRRRG